MVLYAVCLMEPTLVRHSPSLSNIMNSWFNYIIIANATASYVVSYYTYMWHECNAIYV